MSDPESIRTLLLVGIGVVLVAGVLVARFLTKLAIKGALLVVLALVGVTLWTQRSSLADCARDCSCRVLGQDIEVDGCPDR